MPSPRPHRRLWSVAVGLVTALVLAGCAATSTAETRPAPQTTTRTPAKIIPLNGDIAEIVFALGLGSEVVATARRPRIPRPPGAAEDRLPADAERRGHPGLPADHRDRHDRGRAARGHRAGEGGRRQGRDHRRPEDVGRRTDPDQGRRRRVGRLEPRRETCRGRHRRRSTAAKARRSEGRQEARVTFLYVRGATRVIGGAGPGDDIADQGCRRAGHRHRGRYARARSQSRRSRWSQRSLTYCWCSTAGLASVGGVDGLLKIPGRRADSGRCGKRNVIASRTSTCSVFGTRRWRKALKDLIDKMLPVSPAPHRTRLANSAIGLGTYIAAGSAGGEAG